MKKHFLTFALPVIAACGFLFSACDEVKDMVEFTVKNAQLFNDEVTLTAPEQETTDATSDQVLFASAYYSLQEYAAEAKSALDRLTGATLTSVTLTAKGANASINFAEYIDNMTVQVQKKGDTAPKTIAVAATPIQAGPSIQFNVQNIDDLNAYFTGEYKIIILGALKGVTFGDLSQIKADLAIKGDIKFKPLE